MHDIRLDIEEQFPDLEISGNIVNRADLASKVVEDYKFEFLVVCEFIKVAFRAKSRPRNERNIMAPLG